MGLNCSLRHLVGYPHQVKPSENQSETKCKMWKTIKQIVGGERSEEYTDIFLKDENISDWKSGV